MKKLTVICLFFCSFFFTSVFSQEQPRITDSDIAKMSLTELQAYQTTLKIQQSSQHSELPSPSKLQEYASVGKALGQAFKECWSTVSSDAEKFAQSDAGKWTAFLITWKVMGRDAIDLVKTTVKWIVGIGLLVTVTPFFMFMVWRNCISKRNLAVVERTSFWNVKRIYKDRSESPIHESWLILYGLCYLIFITACSMIMFT